jgi:hypothetical protein
MSTHSLESPRKSSQTEIQDSCQNLQKDYAKHWRFTRTSPLLTIHVLMDSPKEQISGSKDTFNVIAKNIKGLVQMVTNSRSCTQPMAKCNYQENTIQFDYGIYTTSQLVVYSQSSASSNSMIRRTRQDKGWSTKSHSKSASRHEKNKIRKQEIQTL